MKRSIKILGIGMMAATILTACSKDEEPQKTQKVVIGFNSVPENLIGGPTSYGGNLYYGAENQITTGYMFEITDGVYAQFPVNYGYTYDETFNMVWGYSFYNGGVAVSDWYDLTDATYLNQLSAYITPPATNKFIVSYGYAEDSDSQPIPYPDNTTLSDYDACGHIYITDANGYTVANPGTPNSSVSGVQKSVKFQNLWICNTTYTYLTMKNGNGFANALNSENKGWFKVQFIAFNDNKPESVPVGYVDVYLANFDSSKAGGWQGIIDDWINVDLSSLPEASILVINMAGSDCGMYGFNTPPYCAITGIVVDPN